MKIKAIVSLLAIMLIIPVGVTAQINPLKKVSGKLGEKLEKGISNIGNKGEAASDSSAVSEAPDNSDDDERATSAASRMTFGRSEVTIPYSESYSFKGRMVMEMTMYEKGAPAGVMNSEFYFSLDQPDGAVVSKSIVVDDEESMPVESTIIIDGKNKCVIMLTETAGMRMGMISSSEMGEVESVDSGKNVKVTKTGRSKVIAGYKCDEYRIEEDKTVTNAWLTKEFRHPFTGKEMQSTGVKGFYGSPDLEGAMMMEMESFEKGELVLRSVTKEVNFNSPRTISVTGYKLRQINTRKGKN